jgi:hypothetical protein
MRERAATTGFCKLLVEHDLVAALSGELHHMSVCVCAIALATRRERERAHYICAERVELPANCNSAHSDTLRFCQSHFLTGAIRAASYECAVPSND